MPILISRILCSTFSQSRTNTANAPYPLTANAFIFLFVAPPPPPFCAILRPMQPPIKWVPSSFPWDYSGRGVMLTTYSHLAPR